jgi:hypothetical protein
MEISYFLGNSSRPPCISDRYFNAGYANGRFAKTTVCISNVFIMQASECLSKILKYYFLTTA